MSHACCVFYTVVIPDMPDILRGMIGNPETEKTRIASGFPFLAWAKRFGGAWSRE